MKFHVTREACCSQDDQLGPLAVAYKLSADATLQELTDAVIRSGFLQFSSTHSVMVGEVGNDGMVRVFSPYSAHLRCPLYLKGADLLARNLMGPGELHFRFVFDFKG